MGGAVRKLFFSAVSRELGSHRVELDERLRDHYHVHTQEYFAQGGGKLLDHLDDLVGQCDAVVHLIGDGCGMKPPPAAVEALLARHGGSLLARRPGLARALEGSFGELSYTQWEAVLALHYDKPCFLFRPTDGAPRDPGFAASEEDKRSQATHLARIAAEGEHYGTFDDAKDLALKVWAALARAGLVQQGARAKPNNLRPSIGALFKGREGFLGQIRTSLQGSGGSGHATAITTVPVHGLGGVGKTRVATEYGWRHEHDYDALLFVEAESPESLRQNLAQLAGPLVLNLPEQDANAQEVQVAAALRWLREHRRWFLIIDNVDKDAAAREVEQLVGSLRNGHVLITSRLSNWRAGVTPLELDVLAEDDAIAFVLERTGSAEEVPARARVKEFDGLALALEQAAAYVRNRKLMLARYLALWKEQREALLTWASPREMQYPVSVAVTWETSVAQLTGEGRTLLELVAWLAPDPIPRSLLEHQVEGLTDSGGALADLSAYSLATLEPESFRVHRLVQEVTRRKLEHAAGAKLRLGAALAWVDAAFAGDPGDVRSWPLLDPLRTHVEAAAKYSELCGLTGTSHPTGDVLNRLAVLFTKKALFREAEPLCRRALAIGEESYGPEHPTVATRLNSLGELLKITNRLAEAEALVRRALSIDEKSYGPEHPAVARTLGNLAGLLQSTNRLTEAELLHRRALAIYAKRYGGEHPSVAVCLNNLGVLLRAMSRIAEAEPLVGRALSIDEKNYGPEHPIVAIRLNNHASLLQDMNRLAEAELLYRRALSIDEKSYGPEHPTVAIRLNNLAGLLRNTNRLEEAEQMCCRALAIDEKSYGPEHPSVATRLNTLAGLLRDTDRIVEAEPLYCRALTTLVAFMRSTGHPHPHLQAAVNNYAHCLEALGHTPDQIQARLRGVAPELFPDHAH